MHDKLSQKSNSLRAAAGPNFRLWSVVDLQGAGSSRGVALAAIQGLYELVQE